MFTGKPLNVSSLTFLLTAPQCGLVPSLSLDTIRGVWVPAAANATYGLASSTLQYMHKVRWRHCWGLCARAQATSNVHTYPSFLSPALWVNVGGGEGRSLLFQSKSNRQDPESGGLGLQGYQG